MRTVKNLLNLIFIVSIATFAIAAVGMVLIQCYSIITLNGTLSATVYNSVIKIAGPISVIAPVIAIILGYINKESSSNEE